MSSSFVSGFYGPAGEAEPDLAGHYLRFVRHLKERREEGRPINIVIDGKEQSVGKSQLGITICRDLDPGFQLEKVVYSAQELHTGYLRREPSMFQYDDVTGLLSNKGSRDLEMQGLISAVSIVRKNGHGTIFIVPKKEMLEGLILNGLANFWIFCDERGRARVFRAFKGARFKKSQPRVPFDAWNAVSPIGWTNLDGDPFFVAYNERAIERNRDF
ncbi:MAG: hypothetical protein ACREC5_02020, partial [Thermoplasmata archaeon]